jgi:hypothetical protein
MILPQPSSLRGAAGGVEDGPQGHPAIQNLRRAALDCFAPLAMTK